MANLTIEKKDDYALLKMHHGKYNLMNTSFMKESIEMIRLLREDPEVKGMIIAGQQGVFSLGIHVKEVSELSGPDLMEMGRVISLLNYEIVSFPKPVVAAITGHAPAGGTLIASGADYRVMADGKKYVFGLNEVGANISVPYDIAYGLIFWLGVGKAYPYLLEGKLISPQEAFEIGIVNELSPLEEVIAKAELQMRKYLKTSSIIFSRVKGKLRQDWIALLEKERENHFDEWGVFWQKEEIRNNFKAFASRL